MKYSPHSRVLAQFPTSNLPLTTSLTPPSNAWVSAILSEYISLTTPSSGETSRVLQEWSTSSPGRFAKGLCSGVWTAPYSGTYHIGVKLLLNINTSSSNPSITVGGPSQVPYITIDLNNNPISYATVGTPGALLGPIPINLFETLSLNVNDTLTVTLHCPSEWGYIAPDQPNGPQTGVVIIIPEDQYFNSLEIIKI